MRNLILFSIFIFLLISSCQKSILGETQTDFVTDSAYLSNSDGILFVQFLTNGTFSSTGVIIYAGDNNPPSDTIGHIKPFGSLTLPIHADNYWMVSPYIGSGAAESGYDVDIKWTPLN